MFYNSFLNKLGITTNKLNLSHVIFDKSIYCPFFAFYKLIVLRSGNFWSCSIAERGYPDYNACFCFDFNNSRTLRVILHSSGYFIYLIINKLDLGTGFAISSCWIDNKVWEFCQWSASSNWWTLCLVHFNHKFHRYYRIHLWKGLSEDIWPIREQTNLTLDTFSLLSSFHDSCLYDSERFCLFGRLGNHVPILYVVGSVWSWECQNLQGSDQLFGSDAHWRDFSYHWVHMGLSPNRLFQFRIYTPRLWIEPEHVAFSAVFCRLWDQSRFHSFSQLASSCTSGSTGPHFRHYVRCHR